MTGSSFTKVQTYSRTGSKQPKLLLFSSNRKKTHHRENRAMREHKIKDEGRLRPQDGRGRGNR